MSESMIGIAEKEIPGATFHESDMAFWSPPTGTTASWDAIKIFYAFWHIPPEEQAVALERFVKWLNPGGWLLFKSAGR